MKFINKQLLTRGIVVAMLLGGTGYHVYAVEELETELKEQRADYDAEVAKKKDELEKLKKERTKAEEDLKNKDGKLEENKKIIEEKQKEIDNKKKEIESLQSDLQAKLDTESNLASANPKNNEQDKSQVLSKENEEKSEQSEQNQDKNSTNQSESANIGTFNVTYYSAYDGTQIGVTADGTDMSNGNIYTDDGYRVVAVDPNVIPMGTILEITTSHGETFKAKASDTGGAIKGNKIDIAVSNPDKAFSLGTGTAEVKIVK